MDIPAGYKELKKGEVIRKDDMCADTIYERFIREDDLDFGNDATGQKYGIGHFKTYRKVKCNTYNKLDEKIIKELLKSNHAINPDCAYLPQNEKYAEICLSLAEKKVIKEYDCKFYL